MPPKKQKKQKKPLMKKTKLKSLEKGVNVQVNIDNSRKPIARRTSSKPANMQPFVNFPSFQPTRVQQLEPKTQFSNADLTKKLEEMYKKQSETTNDFEKKLIKIVEDSEKKNIAPPKKEDSKPGAFDVYADDQGKTIFEQEIKNKIKKKQ